MEQMEEVGLGAEIFTVAVMTETGSGVGFYGPASTEKPTIQIAQWACTISEGIGC
ncbi:hypothetical protein Csa_017961 [Cucumis sativus]|uniref:Uncharacterized protein n=1 Tax=Cucumis sativus TaxID=3659 RepID=A0A0A0L138_CUCSA|nr:hypothetical protein Csa_017961 [Cucumis sativus]